MKVTTKKYQLQSSKYVGIATKALIRKDYSSFRYWKAGIYNKPYMIQPSGQYKGYPLRNTNAAPGFSDHFPVFVYLIKEIK